MDRGSRTDPVAPLRSLTRRLSFVPDAEEELSAASWYESKRPVLGVEFVAAIDAALDRILENPEALGHGGSGDVHSAAVSLNGSRS